MGQEPKPAWRWVTESGTQAGSMAMNEVLYVNKEGFQDQCFLLFNTGLSLGQIWLVFFSLPKQKWTLVPCWNNLWNNRLYMEAIKNWKCYQSPPLKVGTKIRDHLHYSPSKGNKDQSSKEVPTRAIDQIRQYSRATERSPWKRLGPSSSHVAHLAFFFVNYLNSGQCLKIKSHHKKIGFSSLFWGNGTPLQYSRLENPMGRGAWWAAVHEVAKSRTRMSDFTFSFHFRALEKEMATHTSVLAWRIPGTGEPGVAQSRTWLKRVSSGLFWNGRNSCTFDGAPQKGRGLCA